MSRASTEKDACACAARHMVAQGSGVIVSLTGSPARGHVPGATAIGAAFGAIESLTENLAVEVGPAGVRAVCLRTTANTDSRSIQDTMEVLAGAMHITKDQAFSPTRTPGVGLPSIHRPVTRR
jgi:3-oxoacyl-[acyl-carrier protein] reductase